MKLARKLGVLATGVAVCAAAAACAPRPEDCAKAGVHCAGLVTDFGPITEGMAKQAWLALSDAQAAGLFDRVDYIETVDTRDRGSNIATFARAGYDVIITIGAGSTPETITAASSYPALQFISIQPDPELRAAPRNLAPLIFREEDSGFLAGAAAALVSDTGRVAAVCEVEFIESIRRTCEGFRLGALHADPAAEVDVRYRAGPSELLFRDRNWGRSAALAVLAQGADVVFAVGEETAEAALSTAVQEGVPVIGAEVDQYEELPDIRAGILTSAVLDVRASLSAMLAPTTAGLLPTAPYVGRVELAPFRDAAGKLPPDALATLEQMATALNAELMHVDLAP